MYRFLLRPRWIVGHVLVIVTVVAFVNLGLWQLRRLDERRAHNALVAERAALDPRPLDAVAAEHAGDPDALAFRRVVVSGRYVDDAQLLTAPRAIGGRPGQQVLTVLERSDAPAVLVDRGWIPFDSRAGRLPAAPGGQVRVEGVVRIREPGDIGGADQVAQIVPVQIAERLGQHLVPFYVQLRMQEPPADAVLRPTPPPELTEGNHLSYAVQWCSFALIALIGYPVLVWRTARQGSASDVGPPGGGGPDATVPTAVPG